MTRQPEQRGVGVRLLEAQSILNCARQRSLEPTSPTLRHFTSFPDLPAFLKLFIYFQNEKLPENEIRHHKFC